MTQADRVYLALESLGGEATLPMLYKATPTDGWKTKTPFHSIRRIVQVDSRFEKVRPGLYRSAGQKSKKEAPEIEQQNTHSFYQGLLLETGHFHECKTYVPAQDKNRRYIGKALSEIADHTQLPSFTYPEVLARVKSVDVLWFNGRGYPSHAFEVENSTDMTGALVKFVELQDFHIEFSIVADAKRKRDFEHKVRAAAFKAIAPRVRFLDYESVVREHEAQSRRMLRF